MMLCSGFMLRMLVRHHTRQSLGEVRTLYWYRERHSVEVSSISCSVEGSCLKRRGARTILEGDSALSCMAAAGCCGRPKLLADAARLLNRVLLH